MVPWYFYLPYPERFSALFFLFGFSLPINSPDKRSAMSHKGSSDKSIQPLPPSLALVIVEGFTPHALASSDLSPLSPRMSGSRLSTRTCASFSNGSPKGLRGRLDRPSMYEGAHVLIVC